MAFSGRKGDWKSARSGGDLAGALFLAMIVIGVILVQNFAPPNAREPASIQRYLFADIPPVAAPHFSTLDLPTAADAQLDDGEIGSNADEVASAQSDSALGRTLLETGRRIPGKADNPFVFADGQQLLDVDFDLGAGGRREGDLEVGKAVRLNGRAVGTVNVSIDQNSRLYLRSSDLAEILPQEMLARLRLNGDTVAFDAIRNSGIDIRYDPVSDVLVIAS